MSPAATASVDDARQAVLRAAAEMFYAEGISAVGMSDIRDASGVSMRRIYSLYPSKSDLVAAWLRDRHETWLAWFTSSVDRHSADGVDPVLAVFDAIGEWVADPGYRGCAFINSLGESSELDDVHRTIIAAHKRDLQDHLARLAVRNHPVVPPWFAAALAVLVDGAIVQAAIVNTTHPVDAARAVVDRLLETSEP